MRRALEISEACFGQDHPKVAVCLNNLARVLTDTGRASEAEPLLRRALQIDETSLGKNHPNVAIRLNNLAQLLQATNRLDEAEAMLRRAIAIDEASFGPRHPNVARDLNNLGLLLQDADRLAEAEPLMRRGLEILAEVGGKTGHDHPYLQTGVANYRRLLEAMNLPQDGIDHHVREALQKPQHLPDGRVTNDE